MGESVVILCILAKGAPGGAVGVGDAWADQGIGWEGVPFHSGIGDGLTVQDHGQGGSDFWVLEGLQALVEQEVVGTGFRGLSLFQWDTSLPLWTFAFESFSTGKLYQVRLGIERIAQHQLELTG